MRDARVFVIGGGFAGIAAAARLRAHGAHVMLFDDRAALGGRARSDVLDGWTIDVGAQLIATSYERTLAMLRDGDGDRAPSLRKMPGRDVYLRDGASYPINFGSLRSLLAFGAIGAGDKVRLGMSLVPLLARHRGALRVDTERIPESLDAESAGAFMSRAVSASAAAALVEPVSATFCGARGHDVSLAFYLTLGRYGSEGEVLAPSGGWTAMLEFALQGIDVAREVRVTGIRHGASGVAIDAEDGRTWEGDAVVVATDAHSAAELLDPLVPGEMTEWLRGVRYRPSCTVAATVGVPLRRDAFGVLVHNDGREPVSALAIHGTKAAPDARRTGDVVLAWPTPDAADRLIHRPASDVAAEIVPAIEALVPQAAGRIGHVRVYRHEMGIALPSPGFTADRARGRALARALVPPIVLAGDYLTMPLLEGAVASGEDAADRLAARLG
jgi:oxygen-dependent protoporphyrinogen oxidase